MFSLYNLIFDARLTTPYGCRLIINISRIQRVLAYESPTTFDLTTGLDILLTGTSASDIIPSRVTARVGNN